VWRDRCSTTNSFVTAAFAKILSLVDYEEGGALCPHCGKKDVEQRWSAFTAITSKKSACGEVRWTNKGERMAYYKFLIHVGCDWDPADKDLEEIGRQVVLGECNLYVVKRRYGCGSKNIEDEVAMRFFGGEEGDADLSQG
jgi:ssDNA-binding Zn-finger/Zn-ribbon topoisomerase 1